MSFDPIERVIDVPLSVTADTIQELQAFRASDGVAVPMLLNLYDPMVR